MLAPGRSARPWLATWLLALVLAVAASTGWELFWRSRGFRPSVTDNPRFWAVTRARASNGNPDTVVVVGSSRMQFAIDPDAFTAATGWQRPVQLAIPMGPSLPVLRDLADDPDFRGLAVVEIHPTIAFNKTRSGWLAPVVKPYIRAFHALKPGDRLEMQLATFVEENLVSRLPALYPGRVLRGLARGERPRPDHVSMNRERFVKGGFRAVQQQLYRARWSAENRSAGPTKPFPPEAIPGQTRLFAESAARIRRRGGRVVFVRLPSSGKQREKEEEESPRALYWDVFRAKVGAPSVHFEDYPRLSRYPTPDGVHLDLRHVKGFSWDLGRILAAQLTSPGSV